MAKNSAWSPKKKTHQGENWTKARATEAARIKASNGQNVAPGTFNGHSVGGYSIKKYGEAEALVLADAHTRSSLSRRTARAAVKAAARKEAAKGEKKPGKGGRK